MNMLFEVPSLEFTHINTRPYTKKNISLVVARLDKLHPVISGNKLFKLHFFLEQALRSSHKTILTFGGAWSNHLVATAYACKLKGLQSIGLIRGEQPHILSDTLRACADYGMELIFFSRNAYKNIVLPDFQNNTIPVFGHCTIVPEGGYHPLGAKGAGLIMEYLQTLNASHICVATGSATSLAGLIQCKQGKQKVIGIPVLKNMTDILQRIAFLNGCEPGDIDAVLFDGYHFGGYAKKTPALISFMNELYAENQLPTDFVYTAKMMYAVIDQIRSGYFSDGSNIVCLHTGGLQGNSSLPAGALHF